MGEEDQPPDDEEPAYISPKTFSWYPEYSEIAVETLQPISEVADTLPTLQPPVADGIPGGESVWVPNFFTPAELNPVDGYAYLPNAFNSVQSCDQEAKNAIADQCLKQAEALRMQAQQLDDYKAYLMQQQQMNSMNHWVPTLEMGAPPGMLPPPPLHVANVDANEHEEEVEASDAVDAKQSKEKEEEDEDENVTPGTTCWLRHIPNNYKRKDLLDLLARECEGSYDFVYMPIDFRKNANLGYAFINFISIERAEYFRSKLHKFTGWGLKSEKAAEVKWARDQGLEYHIDRYRNSPVMHPDIPEDHRPLLFKDGVQIEFPAPTKKIKGPWLKSRGSQGTRNAS